jgi:predicted nucleotidyltransferase component of viral defense system
MDREQRKGIMESIVIEVCKDEPDAVLKGGTAIMLVYGLDRHSEDIDFDFPHDSPTDIEKAIERAVNSAGFNDVEINVKKDTDTTKRFMVHYGAVRENDPDKPYPLKVEISRRNAVIDPRDVTESNGVRVYKIERLAEQKANAFIEREAGRDTYDISFLTSNYPDSISDGTWERVIRHVEERGLDALCLAFDKEKQADELLRGFDPEEILLKLQENIQAHEKKIKSMDASGNGMTDEPVTHTDIKQISLFARQLLDVPHAIATSAMPGRRYEGEILGVTGDKEYAVMRLSENQAVIHTLAPGQTPPETGKTAVLVTGSDGMSAVQSRGEERAQGQAQTPGVKR